MIQIKHRLLLLLATPVILIAANLKTLSTGAPIGSTGAPGETTCAKSGCHTGDSNVNSPHGAITGSDELGGIYVPGKEYRINLRVTDFTQFRFGFSVTALNADNQKSGTFIAYDSANTQVMNGVNQFAGREYITYTSLGTQRNEWYIKWKAPLNETSPITFYIAAVAADGDGTDEGDRVYTSSFVTNRAPANLDPVSKNQMQIFPNPVVQNFSVYFSELNSSTINASLLSMDGKKLSDLVPVAAYAKQLSFTRPEGISAGIYILELNDGKKILTKKILFD